MLTLPNLLTLSRIFTVPILVGLLWWPQWELGYLIAFGVYCLMGITDYFDGYFARLYAQQSALGRMLDPIADKLLVAACLLMLVADETIVGWSLWAAMVILCREILVSGLREFLAGLKVSVPVSRVAKWKTMLQLVAVGFLIAGPAGDRVLPWTTDIGIVLLWAAAILTIYTGWDYFQAGIRHVINEDA